MDHLPFEKHFSKIRGKQWRNSCCVWVLLKWRRNVVINEFDRRQISLIQKWTSYSWPRPQSCPIFYTHRHSIFWWNILEYSVQNVFFTQHRIKHFAPDKISQRVSFLFKGRMKHQSGTTSTHRVDILMASRYSTSHSTITLMLQSALQHAAFSAVMLSVAVKCSYSGKH